MIKYRIIFIVTILFLGIESKCQNTSDELEYVIEVFLANYYVPEPITNNVGFYKKDDNLYVEKRSSLIHRLDAEIFYNYSSKTFKTIELFAKTTKNSELQTDNFDANQIELITDGISRLKASSSLFQDAEIYPFFGYEGFYNDVINHYKDRNDLTADEQYALSRAHSFKVTYMLYNGNHRNLLESEKIKLEEDSFMNSHQIHYYLTEFEKMRISYKTLKDKFPDYITPSGNAQEKYGHNIVHSYVSLLYNANEGVASMVLEDSLFSDTIVLNSKKILDSCPQNSILITWGDQDTYPLYYIQANEKFRTDVIILSWSLSVFPKYLKMIYDGPFNATPLNSSIPGNLMDGISVLFPSQNDTTYYNVKDFFNYIENNELKETEAVTKYMICPFSSLMIDIPSDCKAKRQKVKLPRHILLSEIAQIDILFSNDWNRTVCFTKESSKSESFILESLLTEKENLLIVDKNKYCK